MAQDRFDKLEGGGPAGTELPPGVKDALKRLERFKALEIGIDPAKAGPAKAETTEKPRLTSPSAPQPAPVAEGSVACIHCDQLNEPARETCWACYRYVKIKTQDASGRRAPDDITLVLDGVTYTSGQDGLPEDVAELMRRIRKRGYSHDLLVEWRQWRATRNVRPQAAEERSSGAGGPDIRVSREERRSVIRIDGKVYSSDDPNLTPELRQLFAYIDANGVTPQLMDRLRQLGQVKVRPPTTAYPSDGDLAFWGQVQEQTGRSPGWPNAAGELERRRAETELAQARYRYENARGRGVGAMVGLAFFFLYILFSIFLR